MIPNDLDIEAFVLEVDPDWRDHFLTIEIAFNHYWNTLSLRECAETLAAVHPMAKEKKAFRFNPTMEWALSYKDFA